jgi:hypothetical protein
MGLIRVVRDLIPVHKSIHPAAKISMNMNLKGARAAIEENIYINKQRRRNA